MSFESFRACPETISLAKSQFARIFAGSDQRVGEKEIYVNLESEGYVCGAVRYCAWPCKRVPFRDASRNVFQGFQSARCNSRMLTPQIACNEYSTWLDTSHSTSETDRFPPFNEMVKLQQHILLKKKYVAANCKLHIFS